MFRVFILWLTLAGCGVAQPIVPLFSAPAVATSGYQGPADVIASPIACYTLRAYKASYVAGGPAKAVNVRRASDNTTQDINVLPATGALDVAGATTFAGTDATGTGSITGTALTFTGGHIGDTVTGGTTLPGTVIIDGSSPSWTVNLSQTVVSATLTLTWGLFVAEWYDQTGNTTNTPESTQSLQPLLLLAGGPSGLPTVYALDSNTDYGPITGSGTYTQPWFLSVVTNEYNAKNAGWSLGVSSGWALGNATNNLGDVTLYAGNEVSISGVSNAFHSVIGIANGASSIINTDGTQTTGLNAGTNSITSPWGLMSLNNGGGGTASSATTPMSEECWWQGNPTTTQQNNLRANVKAYWGTP